MAFYVTAHELAHQWWGLQVVAANVKGRHLILETLSQYAALMVLKKEYGKDKVVQFLEGELDTYLESRKNSLEVPMSLVEKQSHIYYNKGAMNMFVLQEKIGEKQMNLALKRFVKDWNAFDPNFSRERYATSADLLEYIYEVTPDSQKATVFELLETVTTYDASIKKAVLLENDTNSFTVNVQIKVEKWQTDSKGIQKNVNPDTVAELSIYGVDADGNDLLLETKKVQMNTDTTDIVLKSKTKPSKVVLDPNYLLLDINRDNNSKEL